MSHRVTETEQIPKPKQTSGNTLNWNITCRSAAPDTYTYNVTGNLLIFYHANGPAVLATIYTRQGA